MTTTASFSTMDPLGDSPAAYLSPDLSPALDPDHPLHQVSTYYSDIQRVIDHFNNRTPLYEEAQRFHKGDISEVFATEWIADILQQTGQDYLCNFAGRCVDAVYDRLEIQSVNLFAASDPNAPYLNDSLDTSITGLGGAATPTLSSEANPDTPNANPDTTPETTQARNRLLGHPDATVDPQADPSASTLANNSAPTPGDNADLPPSPPQASPQTLELQRTWQKLWKRNKLANFFPRWIKQALINGDGYAMAWDDGTDNPDGIQCQVLDPLTTCVIYDEEFEDVELFGARWFKTNSGAKRINLYYQGWIVKLISKTHTTGEKPTDYLPYIDPLDSSENDNPLDIEQARRLGTAGRGLLAGYPFLNSFVPADTSTANLYAALSAEQQTSQYPITSPLDLNPAQAPSLNPAGSLSPNAPQQDAAWPVPNPYPRQPIFHLRTTDDDLYGQPEHYNAYGPQNAINKLIAVQMATADAQGFPARFALQKSGTIDQNAFDEPDDDELPPDAHSSTIEDRPGVVNLLKDVDQLVQLPAAGFADFFTGMGTYIKFMSFVTSTPMSFYDALGQMPARDTQRENTAPLIKKCASRKRVMTPTIESFVEYLFQILAPSPKTPLPVVHVQWAQSQMVDDLPGWQVLAGKLATGVPFYQVMQEAGYTIAEISGWPTPSTGFTARVSMVLQVAQAAQALAPAITAKVINEQQASQLIDQMILDVRSTPTDASSRVNLSFRA